MSNSLELAKDEAEFLTAYPTAQENWEKANITWRDLEAIRADYVSRLPSLQTTATAFSAHLQNLPGVHSTRVRVKDADHVLEKVVRKRAKEQDINLDNYRQEIKDLIGARALHLFKTDWPDIHDAILATWEQNEDPEAYIRVGDDFSFYEEKSVKHKPHPANYRSVHYGIKTNFSKETHVVELQVRTLFEEAWGEIDHEVRYPYFIGDSLLEAFSSQLNRIAGNADEMASLILLQRAASYEWSQKEAKLEEESQRKSQELNETKARLKEVIEESKATQKQKNELLEKLDDLPSSSAALDSFMGNSSGLGVGFDFQTEAARFGPAIKGFQNQLNSRQYKKFEKEMQNFLNQNRRRQ